MELQMNQSKPIAPVTNTNKNRTSNNAVATRKQALSFQIGGWLTEKLYCWIIHKGTINTRLPVDLSCDRPWQEKAVERAISNTADKHNTALAGISLSDFVLATVGHKDPSQST